MIKREPLLSGNYFDGRIEYLEKTMQDRLRKLRDQPARYTNPEIFLYSNFRNSYQLIFLDYSRGGDIDGLKSKFDRVVSAWENYIASPNPEVNDFSDIDSYVASLWLLCLALLFEVEAPLLERLLECIGNKGKDLLFERLVAIRVTARSAAGNLLHPKPYEPLYKAIDASGDSRQALMAQFLKTWYASLRNAYWYNCHKGPEGGGFFGYWSIEAAAVAKASAIDDEAFREMPYYPKDLVRG